MRLKVALAAGILNLTPGFFPYCPVFAGSARPLPVENIAKSTSVVPAADRPQIITDDKNNAVLVLIRGKEVLRIDERGLHLNGDLDYTGVMTDGTSGVEKSGAPITPPKGNDAP